MLKQLTLLAATALVVSAQQGNPIPLRAVVRMGDPSCTNGIHGNVTFSQTPEGKVHVSGIIMGLSKGDYGFHVHEKGDLTGGCLSAGGHFNPEHKLHGHPNDEERHVGDLGNIHFDENRIASLDFTDSQLALVGPHSILGRALVLHQKADDFGRTDHPDSRKTGNAGGRVACGVIGIMDPVTPWKVNNAATSGTTVGSTILLVALMSFYFIK